MLHYHLITVIFVEDSHLSRFIFDLIPNRMFIHLLFFHHGNYEYSFELTDINFSVKLILYGVGM